MANWEKLIEENYARKNKISASIILEMVDLELENAAAAGSVEGHAAKRLSTKGSKKIGGDPFDEDPPISRSKSAPAGFGVLEEAGLTPAELKKNSSRIARFIEKFESSVDSEREFEAIDGSTIKFDKENEHNQAVIQMMKDGNIPSPLQLYDEQGRRISTGKLKKTKDFGGMGGGLAQPNRGEVSEAFIAAAVVLRFLHLPETAETDAEGAVIKPARGLVNPQQVIDFFINGYKGKEITQVGDSRIEFESSISPGEIDGATPVDVIKMRVDLRAPSMRGLLKIGDPKSFVRTDRLVQQYLRAACEYANKEIIKWAVGVTQDATGEPDASKAMGFFINKFNNVINVSGIGTEAQKATKVDLQMTCQGDGCPATGVSIDGAGDLKSDIKQLARLSLKAGTIKHFGGGAATSPQKALSVLNSVFPVDGEQDAEFKAILDQWVSEQDDESWGFKTVTSKNKKGEIKTKKVFDKSAENVDDIAAHRASELRRLLRLYFNHVKSKLAEQGSASDAAFLKSMIGGLLSNSVKGKNDPKSGKDFSQETGVILVQSTDAGDFYKIDFTKLEEVFGDGTNFSATQVGEDNPYLTVWSSRVENEDGEVINLETPTDIDDPRVLFTMRLLGRHPTKGGEILRLEKGPLMKKVAGLEQGEKLIYRGGNLIKVDD